jgi:hypothetical protein
LHPKIENFDKNAWNYIPGMELSGSCIVELLPQNIDLFSQSVVVPLETFPLAFSLNTNARY